MGRRENPVAPCDKALESLVRWLRGHRTRAGLSYTQLAERVRQLPPDAGARPVCCSADTLARAVSGRSMPRLEVVRAYARACGADVAEAQRLWKQARYRQGADGRRAAEPVQHITYVRDFAELRAALLDLYRKDGSRPYAELERVSDRDLAHSTISRFISGVTGRPTRQFVVVFAQVCGMRGVALSDWGQAWDRAEERRLKGPRQQRALRYRPPIATDRTYHRHYYEIPGSGGEFVELSQMSKEARAAWAISQWHQGRQPSPMQGLPSTTPAPAVVRTQASRPQRGQGPPPRRAG
ncbi:helix-turn-helix domain-containing protein [Streptomyces chrestomyceticus]|uniref:helix-turn-helix domain-containing protein n=1 Tax=Streptomyces chrestomyceticus TaxID=68185 RepID=UPI0033C8D7F0